MNRAVTLPLWVVLVLGLVALWALLDRLLLPSVRWVLRRRAQRVLDHFNRRLAIRIQPFKLTKRQVLIDRLL
ncbi:MAG: glycerol-3-phosphate acyltransferase, partial [Acidobacteria bacterium]|nr:glycerol-3-phosphate acyltransferase [Acidobacteriota bacterium]